MNVALLSEGFRMSPNSYTLYGMSASLFTGKVRAYLRHHNIPFVERGAGHPTYTGEIVPKIGRWIIPVLVTPDGTIIQDGTDIIDHFDAQGLEQYSVYPDDPVMRAVAHLFELFGGEGLLRPAMHYRWNFDSDNLAFLTTNFAEAFPPGLTPTQQSDMFALSSGRMRKAGAAFGVSDKTAKAIEDSYAAFLSLFETHLTSTYFLLGGQATIGDYGLMNGLYAHLARDPHPSLIMKRDAPRVFAWTERMNRPPRDEHVLAGAPDTLFNAVPETLKAMMQFIAEDFLPEMIAHIDFTNDWLDAHQPPPGVAMDRSIGMATFEWWGQDITSAVMPYRTWMLQRLTDHVQSCKPDDQSLIHYLFAKTGLAPLLNRRVQRRVERVDHREVWGAQVV